MFRVVKNEFSPLTNTYDIEYQFDLGKGVSTGSYALPTEIQAINHILSAKHSYISTKYENWVRHKQILSTMGTRTYYNTPGKLLSLDKCLRGIAYFASCPFHEITRLLPIIENDLRNILPSPNNASYNSSCSTLADMLIFCKQNNTPKPTL